MAIFHFSAQIISRGKGQSAIASASYRSGEKLIDEKTGESKFYKREVQPEAMILAPSHAPEWVYDRNQLWNEVEKIEKNSNSQLAREINIALPRELSNDLQKELIQSYVQDQFVEKGMVADIAIHRDDENNPHAHVMLTVRPFNEDGTWGNKKKKEYQLDRNGNKVLDKKGKPKYKTIALTDWDKRDNVSKWREEWSNYANKALEKEGIPERITHLSHADRGLEEWPTIHLGHSASAMEKRGIESERGNRNRNIQKHNAIVVEIRELRERKEALERQAKQELEQQKLKEQQGKKSYFTADEVVALKEAEKGLGEKPTLANIRTQKDLVNDWKQEVDRNYKAFWELNSTFNEAKRDIASIDSLKHRIQEQQEIIDKSGFFQRSAKENARNEIKNLQEQLEYRIHMLEPTLKKMGLRDHLSLSLSIQKFEQNKAEKMINLQNGRKEINKQLEVLNKAEKALEKGFVRKATEAYPELKEAREYMSFDTANKLNHLNKFFEKQGNKTPVSLDVIKQLPNQDGMASQTKDFLLDVINGIAEAQQQAEQEQQKQKQKQLYRGQKKKEHDLGLGM